MKITELTQEREIQIEHHGKAAHEMKSQLQTAMLEKEKMSIELQAQQERQQHLE